VAPRRIEVTGKEERTIARNGKLALKSLNGQRVSGTLASVWRFRTGSPDNSAGQIHIAFSQGREFFLDSEGWRWPEAPGSHQAIGLFSDSVLRMAILGDL
jgi:hypothetical protein